MINIKILGYEKNIEETITTLKTSPCFIDVTKDTVVFKTDITEAMIELKRLNFKVPVVKDNNMLTLNVETEKTANKKVKTKKDTNTKSTNTRTVNKQIKPKSFNKLGKVSMFNFPIK